METLTTKGTLLNKIARGLAIAFALSALSYLVYCAGARDEKKDSETMNKSEDTRDPYMPSTKSAPVELNPEDLKPGPDPLQQEIDKNNPEKKKEKDSKKKKPDIYAPSTKVGILTHPLDAP